MIPILFFDPRKMFADKAGLMTRDAFTRLNDLIKRTGGERGEAFGPLPSYTVATLPSAANNPQCLIYVSNEDGGATVAFSDEAGNWRRVQDRAIVS